MQFSKRTVLLASGLIWAVQVFGQQDTAYALPELTIQAEKPVREGTGSWETGASALASSAVATLLYENPVALRSNGPGLLSTLSIRGSGPARTPVYWEGIPLQSPMNGVYDASLLSLWSGDQLEVRFGGQSSVLGNAAMAGSIHVQSDNSRNTRPYWALGVQGGSFDQFGVQVEKRSRFDNSQARSRVLLRQAQNDFPFTNTTLIGNPEQRQSNSFLRILDMQHVQNWFWTGRHRLKLAVWAQDAYRQIPPSMTEAASDRLQTDRTFRGVLQWDETLNDHTQLQLGFRGTQEQLVFQNLGSSEESLANMLRFNADFIRDLGAGWMARLGMQWMHQRARVEGYTNPDEYVAENRPAVYFLLDKNLPKLDLSLSLRQTWQDDKAVPLVGSFAGKWRATSNWSVHWHASKNYNIPTFNDRYWSGLGNPDLLPESGYSLDASVHQSVGNWKSSLGAYALLIDNWILWQPGSNGLFRPQNLRQVWSRGMDVNTQVQFSLAGIDWLARARYQLNRVSNRKNYGSVAVPLDFQLPYTPVHLGSVGLTASSHQFSLGYTQQFTGKRFTQSDHSEMLPAFTSARCTLAYLHTRFKIQLELENVWNEAYQLVAYRPMPGRNWQLGAIFYFFPASNNVLN
jgi:iron complex outermembrane receptor protein